MIHIAILSNTHGLLRERVKAELAGADDIIHAGDINTTAIVEMLREYGTAYIVLGNNDKAWADGLFSTTGVKKGNKKTPIRESARMVLN